jgi:hypothetical protein
VAAIPARLRLADRRACRPHTDQRLELGDGLVTQLVSPPVSGTLSVASCSNNAESFPWNLDHLAGLCKLGRQALVLLALQLQRRCLPEAWWGGP